MSWKCPECDNEISRLDYSVNTSSREYGNADLSENKEETTSEIITDYESNDNGDSEWDGDVEYECPECNTCINPEELIWIDEDENEDEDEDEENKTKDTTNDEEEHDIIKPKKDIMSHDEPKDISKTAIICKNPKCKHIIVCNKEKYDDSTFFECPNCGTINENTN